MWHQTRSLVVGERVFIHDDEHVWLPGTVVETEPDRVLVRIDLPPDWYATTTTPKANSSVVSSSTRPLSKQKPKTTTRWIQLNDYKDRQVPMQNTDHRGSTCADMADLMYLHEAAILYQIKQRHLTHKPYTRVSEIVIAVNPCQWIHGLYSVEQQHFYAKNFVWKVDESISEVEEKKVETGNHTNVTSNLVAKSSSVYDRLGFEPHIYEVSALAYRGMFLDHKDQTILVSGESGAGKTETVKIVLEHLATLEAVALNAEREGQSSILTSNELVQKIVNSSPIFEAFGNARTMRNPNSSRFGKMTRLHFAALDNGMWGLRGSVCQTYLLEANRVVSQDNQERNFHIFYQLLAAPEEVKERLLGHEWSDATADDFRYLNGCETREGAGSDREHWSQTVQAMELFGWKEDWIKVLLEALATLLRLGNIIFKPNKDEESGCTASTMELLLAAQLLGVEPDVLGQAMTRRLVVTAQDRVEVPLTADSARDSLDALVKRIYTYIFGWIVSCINKQTAGNHGDGVISLLDIYGFESFETNRFEQLCINYANERLHKKYVDDNFARFKREYESEGIEIFDFKKIDNSPVLRLFDGPSGLIGTISEECVRPQGSSANFVQRIKQLHENNDKLIHEKLGGKNQFGVQHFAGPVMYDADHFVERNMDNLPAVLVSTVSQAGNKLIRGAFKEIAEEGSTAKRGSVKRKTVLDRFRVELKELIASINKTSTRYIRCIKPNESLSVGTVDHSIVMRQLKCAGLVAAMDLQKESFPSKLLFADAAERFRCLLDPTTKMILDELPLHDKVQLMMSTLFAPVLEVYRNCDFTSPYACGKTRVYFRAGALEMLESMRLDYYSKRAVVVQAWIRCVQGKQRYARFCKALVLAQAKTRSRLQRAQYVHVLSCARMIQSIYRGRLARIEYLLQKFCAIRIQALVRGKKGRQVFIKFRASAIFLCAWLRMFTKHLQYLKIKSATLKVQTAWRCCLIEQQYLEMRYVAIEIQRAWRSYSLRKAIGEMLAVTKIRRAWLSHSARKTETRRSAASTIRKAWGSYLLRKTKARRSSAAKTIQKAWRSHLFRKVVAVLALKSCAVIKIQSEWREYLFRMKILDRNIRHSAASKIQASWRGYSTMKKVDLWIQFRSAAITVQCGWRTYAMKKQMALSQSSASEIQRLWHANAFRENLFKVITPRMAALRIQSAWRVYQFWKAVEIRIHMRKLKYSQEERPKGSRGILETVAEGETHCLTRSTNQSPGSSLADTTCETAPHLPKHLIEGKTADLYREITVRDEEIHQLRTDIAAIAVEAETHKQELQTEYEERLVAYEEEVLELRNLLQECEKDKLALVEREKEMKKDHEKTVQKLKLLLKKMQQSHKEYLVNIMSVLDKATAARRAETEKLLQEINEIKQARDAKIASLTDELESSKKKVQDLQAAQSQVVHPKATVLPQHSTSASALAALELQNMALQRDQLWALLQPKKILATIEKAGNHSQQAIKEKAIHSAITAPAEKIVESLLEIRSQLEVGQGGPMSVSNRNLP